MNPARALNRPSAALREIDDALIWVGVLLLGIGLVMVYSASIALAEGARFTSGNTAYFLLRHAIALVISGAGASMVFQVPMRLWQQAAP